MTIASDHSRRLKVVGVTGLLGMLAVVTVGTLDTLVWMPVDTAPGYSLDAIYAALPNGTRLRIIGMTTVWAVVWSEVGVLMLAPGFWPGRRHAGWAWLTPLRFAAIICAAIAATVLFHFGPDFAMGNEISDDLPPGVGTTTTQGLIFTLVGLSAFIVSIVLGVASWQRFVNPLRSQRRRMSRSSSR